MELFEIERKLTQLLEPEAVEVVDMQLSRARSRILLRIFLDKTGGITLDDCAYFSDRIGALVDEQELLSGPYVLEVSSPGVDRVVKKEKDFKRFAGLAVRVRLKTLQEGRRHFAGKLLGFENGQVLIEMDGRVWRFVAGEIAQARLDPKVEV